jgi:hypothetical protein
VALVALRLEEPALWTLLIVGSLTTIAYVAVFAVASEGRAAVAWATARQPAEEARPAAA